MLAQVGEGNSRSKPRTGLVHRDVLHVSGSWACDYFWDDFAVWTVKIFLFLFYLSIQGQSRIPGQAMDGAWCAGRIVR
jgi:hypothetical protein